MAGAPQLNARVAMAQVAQSCRMSMEDGQRSLIPVVLLHSEDGLVVVRLPGSRAGWLVRAGLNEH